MEYHTAIENNPIRKEVLIDATTWMNLKNIIPSEKNQ